MTTPLRDAIHSSNPKPSAMHSDCRFTSPSLRAIRGPRRVAALALTFLLSAGSLLPATPTAPTQAEQLRSMLTEGASAGVMLMAHRGDWRHHPENSLPGILSCIELGLEIVEIDVKRTKDGVLILMHDDTIDRTTTGRGQVRELTLAQIRAARLRDGSGAETRHPVPTLREALLMARGRVLLMIDKGYQHFREVAPLLTETGTAGQVLMNGADSLADATRAQEGGLGKVLYVPKVDFRKPQAAEFARVCAAPPRPAVVELIFPEWNPSVAAAVLQFRRLGVRIWVNLLRPDLGGGASDDLALVNPDLVYGLLLERGASVLQTDRPRELRAYVASPLATRRRPEDRGGERN
jgi:glycerophosphoryl diester phosphodiesterase